MATESTMDGPNLRREIEALRRENARLRQSAAAAEEMHAELMALLENTDDFVLFSDEHGKPVIFNQNYARIMKELLGIDMRPGLQPHTFLEDADGRAFWDDAHRRVLSGERFELDYEHEHHGETLSFEVSFNPVFRGEQVIGFCEYTRDVTRWRRMERQLRTDRDRSEANYRTLFEEMLDGFAVHELIVDDAGEPIDYRFLAANRAFERLTGLPVADIVGRTAREVLPDLEPIWLERYAAVVRTGQPVRLEEYSRELDRYYEVYAFRPQPNRFATIFQDVTARRRLEDERRKADRLESIGILAGGIAHDFNNILASILTSIQLAKEDVTREEPRKVLANAEKACNRAANLAVQLLTFSRGGAPIKRTLQLRDDLRQWTEFASPGSKVGLEFDIAADLWPVEVDPGQISQVVHNLVQNAVQAMAEGGTIRVAAVNSARRAQEQIERWIEIRVSDDGPGIRADRLAKIFDPYFTTKSTGSGLGLTTAYSIVRNHGGELEVESEEGRGTTFTVRLHASDDAVEETPAPAPAVRGTGRVLVMDDDALIREVAGTILTRLGYDPVLTAGGDETVAEYAAAREQGRPIDVVVLDLTIAGGPGGVEVLERLRTLDPEVRAVVSSGYSTDPVLANHTEYGFVGIAVKPYSVEELAAAIADARTTDVQAAAP